MKTKLSISVDNEIIALIEKKLEQGVFRNKSHAVEYALMRLLRK
jgi:Arc/MetJ-type ribon-helix-helix transcriptional regulator